MIKNYLMAGMGVVVLSLSFLVWYMNGTITDLNKEIGQIETQLIACQASTDNLANGIKNQNLLIDKFNITLLTKNKILQDIEAENRKIKENVQRQLHNLNQTILDTCEDTIDWMLQEAVDENTNNSDIE